MASTALTAEAQSTKPSLPAGDPVAWVQSAANNEIPIINDDGSHPLRYRTRKVDARGDTTREVIEAREGNVARLVEHAGKPLTAAEDASERTRLEAMLASPADFIRHHKHDAALHSTITDLVRLMPRAMLYTYAPGQPQTAGASPQVVIDFQPDPNFKAPTIASDLLTGLEGRVWIDERTQHLTRAEARVRHPVDFGWGMLARIYPGGTVEFEQTDAGNGHWTYSHLVEHLTVREMMLKNTAQNDISHSYDFQVLPAPIGFQDAIRMLLAITVPLQ